MTSLPSWCVNFLRWLVGLPPVADLSPERPEDATTGTDLVDPRDI